MNKTTMQKTKDVPTLFMGSPDYAAIILRRLHQYGQNIVAVATQPDKRVGRGRELQGPPVKSAALEMNIPCYQPVNLNPDHFLDTLEKLQPELIVVAAYGKILREYTLGFPKHGCINVHASLLPRWRGASPIQAAIRYGDAESGVTIMKMDAGIDTGAIISQRAIALTGNETTAGLTEALARLGADLLVETLHAYLSGNVDLKMQDEDQATYAGLLEKEDGLISFEQPAEAIERQVRAMDPWPNAYFEWDGKHVKVFSVKVLSSRSLSVGQRGKIEKYPCIGTASGDLMLMELQLPGKKRVNGKVFLNGAREWQEER